MTLDAWLHRLERLHPKEMDFDLDRLRRVRQGLGARRPAGRVVTVAGTNGKGSVVATIDALLRAHGLRTGVTTSPHLHRFNERIVIDGREADDGSLIAAFERIESVRTAVPEGPVSLTYFEFAILAALELMADADLDVAVLEVGLGGRLDAVNVIDADVAVITSIDLDHEAWLGSDREAIGREKAGILRAGSPVVVADLEPPHSVLQQARALAAPCYLAGRDFRWCEEASAAGRSLYFSNGAGLALGPLPQAGLMAQNLAAGLQTVSLMLELLPARVHDALDGLALPGRVEIREALGRTWVLDVAHNPQAAAHLAASLDEGQGWVAVFGSFSDKRSAVMLQALASHLVAVELAPTPGPRGLTAGDLAQRLEAVATGLPRSVHADLPAALQAAVQRAEQAACGIVVFGSFTLVAAADRWLQQVQAGEVARS